MKRFAVPLLILGWVLGISLSAAAREYDVRLLIEECGDLYEYEVSGSIEEDDFELLLALCHRPLNLNRADRYMLIDLPGMTYELADRLVRYRSQHGRFKTVEDIMMVDGIGPMEYEVLLPFISVEDDAEVQGVEDIPLMGQAQAGTIGRLGSGRSESEINQSKELERLHQDYFQFKGTGLSYFGFGGLITNRERTEAYYDRSIGRVVSDNGPTSIWDIDKAYMSLNYQSMSLVVGSFDIGFGEKLTFDTTGLTNPHGWRENRHFYTDLNKARLSPDNSLMGAAFSLTGVDFSFGWLDATGFVSYQAHDIYQYYYRYQLDDYYEGGEEGCGYFGFSEGEETGCYSSRVYPAEDLQGDPYSYISFRDAFTELVRGGNIAFNFDDRTRIGVTAYQSETDLVLASEAEPMFAWHSKMPRKNQFGAVGIHGQFGIGDMEFSGEYAHTMLGGNAAYLEALIEEGTWLELITGIRWYDRKYNNPYSRSASAPTITLGSRQRNERGLKVKAIIKPIKGLRTVTTIEGWEIPEYVFQDEETGKNVWRELGQYDLRLSQKVDWDVTRKETLSLLLAYYDNDTAKGGSNQTYETPYDDADPYDLEAMQYSVRGHGSKTKLELGARTKRLRFISAMVRYRAQWEDARRKRDIDDDVSEPFTEEEKYEYYSAVEQYGTLRVTLKPMNAIRLVLNIHKFLDQIETYENYQSPEQKITLGVWYNLSKKIKVHGLLGQVNYAGSRTGRYPDYTIGKIDLTVRL